MAEEPKPPTLELNFDNSNIKTSYANFSHIHVNNSDVYLYFGIQPADSEEVYFENRIVVAHDVFIKIMEFWATRYSALVEIYGDTPRSLRDFDPERVRQAFARFLSQPENEQEKSDA